MKDLIITLAVNGRENYTERLEGLINSLGEWQGDIRVYKEFPAWCRPHSEIPYAFKYDLIERAKDDGYERIFWLDSIMRLIPGKNISELLDKAPHGIVAFHNLGHDLEKYINNTAIRNLEIPSLEGLKQTWGGALFFDFTKDICNYLFSELMGQIKKGSFNEDDTKRENFIAHRHDQAVISYLLHAYAIDLLPYGIIAAKKHITEETFVQYGD